MKISFRGGVIWKFFRCLWDRPTTYGKIDPALLRDMIDDFNGDMTTFRQNPARLANEGYACALLMDRYASAWLEARYRASAHGFDPKKPISRLISEVLGHHDPNHHKVWDSFDQRIRDAIEEMAPFTNHHIKGIPRFPEWKEWAVTNLTLPLPLVKLMGPILVRFVVQMPAWSCDKITLSLKPYINQWIELT
jgi:hypothetical protein